MIFIIIALLGLVEGLTEFLPVSSTGHLILVGHLLGYTGNTADTLEVFIQFGAILAVVIQYRARFLALLFPPTSPSEAQAFAGRKGITLLIAVTVPGLIAGKLLHDAIKAHLFTPLTVCIGLGVGGLLILFVEWFGPKPRREGLAAIGIREALIIGLCQCLALWPGMSRSSSTILGGLLLGYDRRTAAEFSFLAAVPLISAATFYDLWKSRHFLSGQDVPLFALGFVVSFVAAWMALRVFMRYLSKHDLKVFGYYRIVLAAVAAFYFMHL